jgi:hypothetical protein
MLSVAENGVLYLHKENLNDFINSSANKSISSSNNADFNNLMNNRQGSRFLKGVTKRQRPVTSKQRATRNMTTRNGLNQSQNMNWK